MTTRRSLEGTGEIIPTGRGKPSHAEIPGLDIPAVLLVCPGTGCASSSTQAAKEMHMNPMLRTTIASALVGGIAWLTGIQSAEAAHSVVFVTTPQQQHDHASSGAGPAIGPATMPKAGAMMARLAAIDAQIERLVADMNSFTGEMKITAMSELLTALVKRQSMMRQEMMAMHEQMMGHMKGRMMSPPIPRDDIAIPEDDITIPDDTDPDLMCAPPRER
jgi:hypothetical protein